MKYIKSYKIFEASKGLLMKMDMTDIFQNVIDAGFDVKINLIANQQSAFVVNISINTPADYLIWSKDDNSPERMKSIDHNESEYGLNIRDNILQLKSYAESKGYKIDKLTSGTFIIKDIDMQKDGWFTSLNIVLSKVRLSIPSRKRRREDNKLHESIVPNNDFESDLLDICQELIDDGYSVDFGKKVDSNNVYKNDIITIYKRPGGSVNKINYTDIKETIDRIERYLSDKYSKTLVLPVNYSKYMDITGLQLDNISGGIFKAIIEYKVSPISESFQLNGDLDLSPFIDIVRDRLVDIEDDGIDIELNGSDKMFEVTLLSSKKFDIKDYMDSIISLISDLKENKMKIVMFSYNTIFGHAKSDQEMINKYRHKHQTVMTNWVDSNLLLNNEFKYNDGVKHFQMVFKPIV